MIFYHGAFSMFQNALCMKVTYAKVDLALIQITAFGNAAIQELTALNQFSL